MEYVIAIYRSRNVTIQVYNYLLKSGVTCALISTPRSANAETSVGFYLARQNYGGTTITRI